MSEDSKTPKMQILIAIIGLLGVLGAALIANWDKISSTSTRSGAGSSTAPDGTLKTGPIDANAAVRLAEEQASEWFAAFKRADVETLTRLSKTPFYFDSEVLVSPEDVADRYRKLFSRPVTSEMRIASIKSGVIRDFVQAGLIGSHDRIYSNMRVVDDDIAVALKISMSQQKIQGAEGADGSTTASREEWTLFIFRRTGNTLELAGFWN